MSKSKKNLKSNSKDVSMNFVERTIYRKLFDTLEKSLIACYDTYVDFIKNYCISIDYIYSYEEYVTIVYKKIRVERS